jgi:hypothetical protein
MMPRRLPPARHGQEQRHGHVGGIFGQNLGRVGDHDAARNRGRHIDIVDAVAEIRNQLEADVWLAEKFGGDLVGHGRHQNICGANSFGELCRGHRCVIEIEPGIEKLAHARFGAVRQLARDHHQRLFLTRNHSPEALRC